MANNKFQDFLLNRIYEEMKQANVNRIYAELLLDKQVARSRNFNIFIIAISSFGALTSTFKLDVEWTIGSSALIALASLLNQLCPFIFLKSEDVTKLTRLHTETYSYFNKLQDLFCLFYSDKIDEDLAQSNFGKLTVDYAPNATDISRIFGKIHPKMEKKAMAISDEYLNTIYNNGDNE